MPFGEQKDINHRKNPVKAFLQESLNRQHSRDQALKQREKSKDVQSQSITVGNSPKGKGQQYKNRTPGNLKESNISSNLPEDSDY